MGDMQWATCNSDNTAERLQKMALAGEKRIFKQALRYISSIATANRFNKTCP